ncbi:polysaccharide deacetylase family protein [Paenibacillus vietnamensis]|uniref:polysaccharide deacetylase family protein n=1 Tax=Paenibacillus vietnamensis TaxID=2590547 RepID=UPI0037CB2ACF
MQAFNRYGLKGTFHLNSGKLGQEGYISAEEAADLFRGHEISAHTVTHPFLERPRCAFAAGDRYRICPHRPEPWRLPHAG